MSSTLVTRGVAVPTSPHRVLIGVIAVVVAVATLRAPEFLTIGNLVEILLSTSTYFIVGCSMAMVVVAGGTDFSVGATYSVGALVACTLMVENGVPWLLAVVLGVAAGAAVGWSNGLLVSYAKVPPMIATVANFFIATGVLQVAVKGVVTELPAGFLQLSQASVVGVPLLVLQAALVWMISWVVVQHTAYGYEVRAVGANLEAARSAGIPVRRITITVYAMCGAGSAYAGILYAARTSAGQPDAGGFLLTLQVLTAVLVGGVSLSGGVGTVGGVAWASLLFGVLINAIGIVELDAVWSDVVIGVVLVAAVALDGYRRRRLFRLPDSGRVAPSVNRTELERLVVFERREEAQRIGAAVASERRRIERDLHDGAQQHLVASAILLSQALDRLPAGPDDAGGLVASGKDHLHKALADLRSLSSGEYPTTLSEHGLVWAVRSLVVGSILDIDLRADEVPRQDEAVEAAAYFLVAEAMTNILKYAPSARVRVQLTCDDEALSVVVGDDGHGGADRARGSGLRGLDDRVTGAGGALMVTSVDGQGTTLAARFPMR